MLALLLSRLSPQRVNTSHPINEHKASTRKYFLVRNNLTWVDIADLALSLEIDEFPSIPYETNDEMKQDLLFDEMTCYSCLECKHVRSMSDEVRNFSVCAQGKVPFQPPDLLVKTGSEDVESEFLFQNSHDMPATSEEMSTKENTKIDERLGESLAEFGSSAPAGGSSDSSALMLLREY